MIEIVCGLRRAIRTKLTDFDRSVGVTLYTPHDQSRTLDTLDDSTDRRGSGICMFVNAHACFFTRIKIRMQGVMNFTPEDRTSFPFADSRAALALRRALEIANRERGLSIRKLGAKLGYKQATVLSHMASGRVPVPLERAIEIARAVNLPEADFLAACVEQRSPEAGKLLRPATNSVEGIAFSLAGELSDIAGHALDDLNDEQKSVLRKVVADPRPARRWLSEAEIPTIEGIRRRRPNMAIDGLSASDRAAIDAALRDKVAY